MGNKSSSPADLESRPGMPSLTDPFPVSDHVSTILHETTTIMERLLTTADVFDISGAMKKMSDDTCGGYVFFLAKQFEKTILAASVKNSAGNPQQIVYQSTTQSVKEKQLRDKICTDVTDLSLRAIVTVIALVASIQIGESRRSETEGAVLMLGSGPGQGPAAVHHGGGTRKRARDPRRLTQKQRGGRYIDELGNTVEGNVKLREDGLVDGAGRRVYEENDAPEKPVGAEFDEECIRKLHDFFYKKRYVDGPTVKTTSGSVTHKLTKPSEIKSPYTFRITYEPCTKENIIRASVSSMATRKADAATMKQPPNLALTFLNPVKLVLGDDRRRDLANRRPEVVPFSIALSDTGARVLFAGIIVEGRFCVGFPSKYGATVGDTPSFYYLIYQSFKLAEQLSNHMRDPNAEAHRTQGDTFKHLYDRGTENLSANILSAFGSRALEALGFLPDALGRRAGVGVGIGNAYRVPAPVNLGKKELGFGFTGPSVSLISTKFGDKMKTVHGMYMIRSSPARVRAKTLAGVWNPATREQTTGVCSDSYWSEKKTLESIFPWTTLQFLYLKELSAYAKEVASPAIDIGAWTSDFLTPLKNIYNGAEDRLPSITGDESMLSKLRFTPARIQAACSNSGVSTPIIQAGIRTLYDIYNAHVAAVLDILNNLVQVLKDPVTNVDIVRLHSKVAQSEDSAEYVREQTKKARQAISAFYVNIEREYAKYVVQLTQSNEGDPIPVAKTDE